MKYLVSTNDLKEMMSRVIVYDCRYRLTEPEWGYNKYMEGHIPGAFFFDLNKDMASEVREHGGRHPLPDMSVFTKKLESTGLNDNSMVVCYDDNLSGAARMWFLLKYIGHDNCYILDGGIEAWVSSGGELEKGERIPDLKGKISPRIRKDLVADHRFIWENRDKIELIDARENYRYRGESEPIDKIPGRIPGSVNIPYLELMNGSQFKGEEELRKIFREVDKRPVMYCGSGVTSCINYFVMDSLGMSPMLYVGSYSDWISFKENPIEKDDGK
ncbi:sulfurtransferase [Cuniculiplasma sp. SKW3]|uniref:sulfurtransferase n=1 Tax=Cuniculiplasma sp. SKW3 TaxID=3400170 RepID=UPI003FD25069